jgi:prenylcysteine oxidase/farnesylcysteine lyase
VSLAGSESGLWAIKGGNWQLAAGLLKTANTTLHLQEGVDSISDTGDYYVLKSDKGQEYKCKVTVIATPLDEVNIKFTPPVSIPPRKMQHTHATFVRGLLNPVSVICSSFLCSCMYYFEIKHGNLRLKLNEQQVTSNC